MAKTKKSRFLTEYSDALKNNNGVIFIGAGASRSAGYPSWAELLKDIGEELGINSSDIHDLAALAQWSIRETGNATRVRNVIKDHIGKTHPVPDSIKTIARLPFRHIWTTNYDRLIERAFEAISRPIDTISGVKDLSLKAKPGAVKLYKMHGSVDRLDDIVISTDDYELYRSKRGAYLPLLQADLTSMSVLFIGISFTDPNIKHVLSLIRESFTENPPEHFAIIKQPTRDDYNNDAEFEARAKQHALWSKDLQRYGLHAIEVTEYDEVPALLQQLERRVALQRVWVSGSWPINSNTEVLKVYTLAEQIGQLIGNMGLSLVTGGGNVVGSATITGFLDSLRGSGGWDLERRLITRPFPQPLSDKSPNHAQWTELREELARLSGVVIFIGGTKWGDSGLVDADGVLEEADLARKAGAFLLPIGVTGGAAKQLADSLRDSSVISSGHNASRPTDEELNILSDATVDITTLVDTVEAIIKRVSKVD